MTTSAKFWNCCLLYIRMVVYTLDSLGRCNPRERTDLRGVQDARLLVQ